MKAGALVQLGRTRLQVTRMGLGMAPLGLQYRKVDDQEARAVVKLAYEKGIRFFDTAPLYGSGLSERRAGDALRDTPRGSFVIATKVGRLLRIALEPNDMGTSPVVPVFDFSYDGVLSSFEESLERLGLDRVDVLHIHDPDQHYNDALTGAFRALDKLRADGVIGAVGVGMNQAEMLTRFADERDFDCFLLAGRYTLLDQSGLRELLPLCESKGISVIIGGVFNSGILADPRPGAPYNYVPASDDLIERALQLRDVCSRHGVSLKSAALHFPFGHPAVTTVLVGCRSREELEENVTAFESAIPAELWHELKTLGLLPSEVPTP